MLIFTGLSVGAIPFPSILVFFNSLKEEFADDFGSGTFHHFLLFLAKDFSKFFFRQVVELLASDGVHNELGSLINIKIDFLVSVECKVVGVNTFFAFLAESLLEVRTDSVGWVTFII